MSEIANLRKLSFRSKIILPCPSLGRTLASSTSRPSVLLSHKIHSSHKIYSSHPPYKIHSTFPLSTKKFAKVIEKSLTLWSLQEILITKNEGYENCDESAWRRDDGGPL